MPAPMITTRGPAMAFSFDAGFSAARKETELWSPIDISVPY